MLKCLGSPPNITMDTGNPPPTACRTKESQSELIGSLTSSWLFASPSPTASVLIGVHTKVVVVMVVVGGEVGGHWTVDLVHCQR